VGLVPVAVPLFTPVEVFAPVVPVELFALPEEPAAAPVAAAPPVLPPAAPPPPACANAIDELIARIEARTAVVIFMGIPFCCIRVNDDLPLIVP
jgi:hypothetical protein